jgi:hypothetical protein
VGRKLASSRRRSKLDLRRVVIACGKCPVATSVAWGDTLHPPPQVCRPRVRTAWPVPAACRTARARDGFATPAWPVRGTVPPPPKGEDKDHSSPPAGWRAVTRTLFASSPAARAVSLRAGVPSDGGPCGGRRALAAAARRRVRRRDALRRRVKVVLLAPSARRPPVVPLALRRAKKSVRDHSAMNSE